MLVEIEQSMHRKVACEPSVQSQEPSQPFPMGLAARALYLLARFARRRSAVHQESDLKRTTDETKYRSWRHRELEQQLMRHFDKNGIASKDVLDFGCGTGELCRIMASCEPQSLTGVDLSVESIRRASETCGKRTTTQPVTFICSKNEQSIPMPDASVDLICCFDVVEHIPCPEVVLEEFYRVLRPGGRVWVWWSPWRGPFGHHLESLLPLPWIHLFFPEQTIFKACAAIYDHPDFVPRHWDIDPVSGNKKPNKWLTTTSFHPFLNKLTRKGFENCAEAAGLKIARREIHGFQGSRLRRSTRVFLPIPILGDCVASFYVYELSKPL